MVKMKSAPSGLVGKLTTNYHTKKNTLTSNSVVKSPFGTSRRGGGQGDAEYCRASAGTLKFLSAQTIGECYLVQAQTALDPAVSPSPRAARARGAANTASRPYATAAPTPRRATTRPW